jgi:NAD(P)H-dependent FMN reductase
MSAATFPKIGVIVGSQRQPRAGLQVSKFVLKTLEAANLPITLSLIDLASWDFPIINEPLPTRMIVSPDQYTHPLTRAWSVEISSYSAFIFVTPEYNAGYPASLKNALDYLYKEWNGKPAMIVSYGGVAGGGRAARQLAEVLTELQMPAPKTRIQMKYPSRDIISRIQANEDMELDKQDDGSIWNSHREEICETFVELVDLMKA